MWTSIKWYMDKSSLICTQRRNSEKRNLNFPVSTMIIIELPSSLGNPKECVELLSRFFQTNEITELGDSIYQVKCSNQIHIKSNNLFKKHKVITPSVHSILSVNNIEYHTSFDDDYNIVKDQPLIKYVPRICF